MKVGEFKKLLETSEDDIDLSDILPKPETKLIVPEISTEIPIKGAVAHIKHSCNPGDIMASMIACKRYYEMTGRKIKYIQRVNMAGAYYPGAVHPTVDSKGTQVTLNNRMYEMVKPLVESQEYIDSMEIYDGQRIDIDFDTIRGKTFVNMPQGSLQGWLFYAFPDLEGDISKSWITLEPQKRQIEEVTKNKVILNFTERYRNNQIQLDYFFLKEYAPDLIFAGTEAEHFKFCHEWGLNIPRLEENDFLDTAYAIRSCRFLLSNQSFCWNLATAMGTPRVLEVCSYAHNCMPFYGDNNYGYFHQTALGYYFRKMYNKTANK